MKRFSVICALLTLALPVASSARPGAPGDGSLVVRNGAGKVGLLQTRGGAIGHFADGLLVVRDFNPDDGVEAVVTGAEHTHVINDQVTRYSGHDVRFRFIGGKFTITVTGAGIDLSAVGKGTVLLAGDKTVDDDGTFSLNGSAPQPISIVPQTFTLGTPASG